MYDDHHALVDPGEGSRTTLLILPLDGGPPVTMTVPAVDPGETIGPGNVTRNGKWYVGLVLRDRHVVALHVVSLTDHTTRIVRLPFEGIGATVGMLPDGQHAIVAGKAGGDTAARYYLVPLDGTAPRPYRALSATPIDAHVAPNGDAIAFTTEGTPTSHIYDIDLTPVLHAVIKH